MRALFTLAFLAMGCRDGDGDGTRDGRDCAPNDPQVHPDAEEVCDGVDNDCSGQIDEGVSIDAFLDRDLDGFGDDGFVRRVCELPDNGAVEGGDCDDFDAGVGPAAAELCDGVDQDCDGEIDEGVLVEFYADADGDGHGVPGPTTTACTAPTGTALTADDCDDAEPLAWTGAAEGCDGIDNDCDGATDEDVALLLQWTDDDGDGYGDPALPLLACGPGPGIADNALDCDDADPLRSPAAIEMRGNGVDEDCDLYVDEYGVGPGNEFATVDEALDTAPDGSVVQLDDGFHLTTVDLTGRDVTLAGEGCDRTTLYADSGGSAVTVDAGVVTRMTISGGSGTLDPDLSVYGGGVLVTGDVQLLDLCVVGNAAARGGGVAVIAGTAVLDGVLVAGNTATEFGGGVYARLPATLTVLRSRVLANEATLNGGGLGVFGAPVTVENTVVAGNLCTRRGGGMYAGEFYDSLGVPIAATVSVLNCTFHANLTDLVNEPAGAANDGVGLLATGATADVRNTLFTGHPDPRFVLDKSNGAADGVVTTAFVGFRGNAGTDFEFDAWILDRISADPEYVLADPALPATAWDLRLRAGSGYVDVGDPAILDPDGSRSDLGAYGGARAGVGWDFGLVSDDDADGILDGYEVHHGLATFLDDGADDPDADGVTNLDEFGLGSDPFAADSDADGVDDGAETPPSDPTKPQDQAPVADAGLDRYTLVGQTAVLDAAASFDPNVDALGYAWSILEAPPTSLAALGGAATSAATLAPDVAGDWTIELSVDDGGTVRTDVVTVRAWDGAIVPDDHPTIQEALDAISSGEAVGVRPGTWIGPLDTGGIEVAILGLGAAEDVVLDGAATDSVIRAVGGSLTLSSLTIEGGFAAFGTSGGGIHVDDVTLLELADVTVRQNRATDGGGVWANVPGGSVRVLDSRIVDNVAEGAGGGLWFLGEDTKESLVVERSLLAGNTAATEGGAIRYHGGTLPGDADATLSATAFADNTAAAGAALWHTGQGSDDNLWNVAFVGHRGGSIGWGDQGRAIVMSDAMADNVTTLFFDDADDGNPLFDWQHFEGVWVDVPDPAWSVGAGFVATVDSAIEADPLLTWIDDGDPLDDVFGPRAGSPSFENGFLDHLDTDGSRTDVGPCGGPVALPRCARFAHDDDGDGMGDGWEVAVGLDPTAVDDGSDDDGDGLTNGDEHTLGTLPLVADSDRDGLEDGLEDGGLGDPVSDLDHRPRAVLASPTAIVDLGDVAALDGGPSSDPDADPITFAWRVISVPPGSAITTASLSGANTATPTFVPDVEGGYRLGLVTDDGAATSREALGWVRVPVTVDVPGDFASFDEAYAAVEAGTIIRLGPGTWPLAFTADTKPFGLAGAGIGVTVIEGTDAGPMLTLGAGSDVRLLDLTLAGGTNRQGGAIRCDGATLSMSSVRIERSTGETGGAAYLAGCTTTIQDLELVGNFASASGAGLYASGGTLDWVRGRVEANRSEGSGGGLYLSGTVSDLRNVVLHRNTSETSGSAIYLLVLAGAGSFVGDHLTVTGNDGTLGAIYRVNDNSNDLPVTLTNSIIADNHDWGFYDADVDHLYTDLHHNGWSRNGTAAYPSGLSAGPTDLAGDPRFVSYDLDQTGNVAEVAPLRGASGMRDVGVGATDPDGSTEDLGAWGGPDAPADWDVYFRDTDGDGLSDGWESAVGLDPLVFDPPADDDGDGLDTAAEHALETDPFDADSDGDGVDDATEDLAGEDPGDPLDHAPAASTSADQTGAVGVLAVFTGSGTDPQGDPIGYAWSLLSVPGRSSVTDADLSGQSTSVLSLTPDAPGRYLLSLVVDDGVASSEPETVELLVAGEVLVPEDYATVAEGVASTADGSTLRIGPGTWPARVALDGRDLTIAGAGRDLTVLDGEDLGTVLVVEGQALTLQDLTVTGGLGGRAGGVRADDASLTLVDVTLVDNRGARGGAVFGENTDVVGTGLRVIDNLAGYQAGGLCAELSSTVVVDQSLFAGNYTIDDSGGAVRLNASPGTFTNVVFADNEAKEAGGIYCVGSNCAVVLDHVTAVFNVAETEGAFLRLVTSGSAVFVDSLIYGNHGAEQVSENSTAGGFVQTYTLVAGGDPDPFTGAPLDYALTDTPLPLHGVDGNQIGVDPLLLGASDDGDWTNDDWTPDALSPAVDAGDPLGTPDPDATPPDLGAFGGSLGSWLP